MSTFLYLVTGTAGVAPNRDEMIRLGLYDRLERRWHSAAGVEFEHGQSCIVSPAMDGAEPVRALPTPYAAREAATEGNLRAWVVWNPNRPLPTEASLARRFQPMGERVVLGDGQRWLVPTLSRLGGSLLPRTVSVSVQPGSDSFRFYRDVDRAWAAHAEDVERLASWARACARTGWQDRGPAAPPPEIVRMLVADALSLAYRVGPAEIDVLGLLPDGVLDRALGAVAGAYDGIKIHALAGRGGGECGELDLLEGTPNG